ncbi:hypothetical protein LRP88_11736 [Fusarium phalaenopsidis]
MSKEDTAAADSGKYKDSEKYLQKWGIEEIEGWYTEGQDKDVPYYRNYLDSAFASLGASGSDAHHVYWIHNRDSLIWEDPITLEGDPYNGVRSEAYFTNSFILNPGIIIADNNLAVKPALDDSIPDWEDMFKVTHIRRWSDAAWMQWTKVCEWFNGDVTKIKYIIRSRITNKTTLSIIFEALISKYGGFPTIGKWDQRFTLDVATNPGEFHAILGSPNGAGAAFILLNHKGTLGVKTINKVEIFIPNIPYTVTGTTADKTAQDAKIMLLFTVTSP